MTPAVGPAWDPEGLDPGRAVQIITARRSGAGRCGSGYQVTGDLILTAAHVVGDAVSVRVRFVAEDGGVREVQGAPTWSDSASDIALLRIAGDGTTHGSSGGERYAAQVSPVRFARVGRQVECEALGFPRFRLRSDAAASDRGALFTYRDTHHALGRAVPYSYRRRGTLEISGVAAPEYDPERGRSPWEGMSGAAVWSGGCLIGIVSEHHRSDGLGMLTASPVNRWYTCLTPAQIDELADLIDLPADAGRLDEIPLPSPPVPAASPVPRAAEEETELRAAAGKLASAVRDQWEAEERRRRVHDPRPLAVSFRLAGARLSDHWENIRRTPPRTDPGPLPLDGPLDRIVQKYRSIPSGRLVVLGAAGAGKTILALRFVLDWLRARTPGPVPVVFGLGSWNPETTPLRDWMCDQLVRDYGLTAPDPSAPERNLAGALVDGGWILPVLDGFDEIAKGLRGEALEALNLTTTPLLLTSRPKEYARAVQAADVLTAAAVVELDDLTLSDLADYLARATRPGEAGGLRSTVWEPVLAELHAQPRSPAADNLAAVLATPLMVAMARTIYSDASGRHPEELLDITAFPDAAALRKHLLAAFTPAAYKRPPGSGGSATGRRLRRHWTPERAEHWLGYLATHLVQCRTYDLAWWQLGTTMRRSSRTLVVGFLAALSFGLPTAIGNLPVDLIGTPYGFEFALVRGLVVGFLHGLVAGVGFGLVYAFVSRGAREPSRVRVQIFGRAREKRGSFVPRFKVGLTFGIPAALTLVLVDRGVVEPIGLGDGLDGGLVGAILFAPGVGLAIGLVMGIMAWLEVPNDIGSAVSPAALLNDNRNNVVTQMLLWALVFGLASGLGNGLMGEPVAEIANGPLRGLLIGLVFGIEAAFAGGLGYGLSFTAWGQWAALSRIWLPLTGRLPWALIAFLDDACERGVLRQAGAVYQFRHAELRDHLAHVSPAGHDQHPRPSE